MRRRALPSHPRRVLHAGLAVERYQEDGLGPAAAAGAVLPSGVAVVLTELEHLIEHNGATGPTVQADASEVAARGAAAIFHEALAVFGLDPARHVEHEPPPETAAAAAEQVERLRAWRAARQGR